MSQLILHKILLLIIFAVNDALYYYEIKQCVKSIIKFILLFLLILMFLINYIRIFFTSKAVCFQYFRHRKA